MHRMMPQLLCIPVSEHYVTRPPAKKFCNFSGNFPYPERRILNRCSVQSKKEAVLRIVRVHFRKQSYF